MRLYKLAINNADYDVIIKEVTTDEVRAEVNGEEYTVMVKAINDLQDENKVVASAAAVERLAPTPAVAVSPTSSPSAPTPSANANAVKAPIPGQIISVNVSAGDKVLKGQKVLVLEAMKLENILTSERDGIVEKVLVKEGEVVDQDQDLILIA